MINLPVTRRTIRTKGRLILVVFFDSVSISLPLCIPTGDLGNEVVQTAYQPLTMNDKYQLNPNNIVPYLADIFLRRGSESYLGESVTMSQHMLQAAQIAEQEGESTSVIVAALLHDIGHYTGEFPEDYIEQGMDNRHQLAGAAVLEKFFHADVVEPVRWHVETKRYLCAVDDGYFACLSGASVETLKLQGGPFDSDQIAEFEQNPYLDTIIRVRKYDDAAKDPLKMTPPIEHYLPMIQGLLDSY